jgi:hypothetical protein
MSYIAGDPKSLGTRQVWEGAAVAGQKSITIPGGFVPGSCDVFVGGANLLSSDYVDSDGGQILLNTAMAAGTAYRVVVMPRFSGIVQNTPRLITDGTATQAQTTIPIPGGFMGGAGMTDVFVNGIALTAGTDYDDTSGTQIVLAKAMNTGMQYRIATYAPGVSVQPVSGQLAGFRNRIINGAMQVNQRGTQSVSTGTYGGPDHYWMAISGGAGGAFNQSQGAITFGGYPRAACIQTVTTPVGTLAGNAYWSGIAQFLEGYTVYDLIGKPLAISFIFQASVPGQYSVNLRDSADALSYVTTFNVPTANTPQKVTLIVPPVPSNANIPNNNGRGMVLWIGTQNGGNYMAAANQLNQWVGGLYMAANGNTTWSITNGATIAVAELQLEAGNVATQFENRPFGTELALCQRYYQKTFAYGTAPANNAGQAGALFIFGGGSGNQNSYQGQRWYFPVTMRAAPSVATYNPITGTAGYWRNNAVGGDVTSPPSVSPFDNGLFILMNNGSTVILGASDAWYIHAAALAEVP